MQFWKPLSALGVATSSILHWTIEGTGRLLRGTVRANWRGMAAINSFRELFVWQRSMSLAEHCYLLTKRFKLDDQLVLGREIRKSCVSVPSNIAEGFGRHHTTEYVHHLRYSNGSNNELQTQVELAKRVKIVRVEEAEAIIRDAEEVGRMLHGLIGSLERGR